VGTESGEICVSYFTLRTIIVLMETMKDFYSSTTIPPSAAVATRRRDLRVNEYAAYSSPLFQLQHAPIVKDYSRASKLFIVRLRRR
jgi:hypothetical protein